MRLRGLFAFLAFVPGAVASAPSSSRAPIAVVIATAHDERAQTSEIRWLDGSRTVRTVRLPHSPCAVLRGDLLAGSDAVVVVADDESGTTLYRADSSGLKQLATGLLHASRPLASADGWVYVERGGIDAIDPVSGASRHVVTAPALAWHLAGEQGNSIVVYRVQTSGADVVLVDKTTGAVRTVVLIEPYARDFTVENGALVFADRDRGAGVWTVERVDLATGTRTRLHDEKNESPAPFAFSGDVAWTAPRRSGLFIGGKTIAPLGAGFDDVRAASGSMALVMHVPASGFDETYLLDRSTGAAIDLSHGSERIEPIGFVGSGAVLR